jgi:O-antigen/teichoic acid export membrane protein
VPEPDVAAAARRGPHVLRDAQVGRRVVHGGAVRIAGFAVVNLLGAAGVVVLQRTLGVVDYGRYGTALALVAIVSLVTDAGLTITGSRELALHPHGEDRRALVGTILGLRCALSAVGVGVCAAFAAVAGYGAAMVAGVAMAGGGAILIAGQAALTLPLIVDLRNGRLTLTELAKQVILLAGFGAVWLAGGGLVAFLAIQIAVGAGSLALTARLLAPEDRTWPQVDLGAWRDLARKALPVAAAAVLAIVYVRMLVVLASLLTSERQTGLVVASARVVEIAGGLPLLVAGIVLPVAAVAAREDRVRLRFVTGRLTEVALLLGSLVAVALAVAAHPLVVLLGGEAFAGAAPVLRIHAAAVATFFVIQSWVVLLLADGRRRAVVVSSLVGLVAVVAAGLVLIPLYDAKGAAIAAVIADVADGAALAVSLRSITGRAWPTPASFMARFAVALAAALAVGVLLPAPAVARAAVAVAVLGAGALALRIVPSEVLDAVPRRRRAD